MSGKLSSPRPRWLPVREARKILNVTEATIRQWSDRGQLNTFRTPGGHRRFLREDLLSLLPGDTKTNQESFQRWEQSVTKRIRKYFLRTDNLEAIWYQDIDEDGRNRMRLYGRRLLSLFIQSLSQTSYLNELIRESELVGTQYGVEMASRQVPLNKTVGAFIIFRNLVSRDVNNLHIKRISRLADHVLLGIAEGYQKILVGPKSTATTPGGAS